MTPYYDDGQCVIYHGDALETLDHLSAERFEIALTDPPYIIGAVSAGSLNSKSGGWADMMNSSHWFTAWYRQVAGVLKNNGQFWSFLNWRTLPVVMRAAVDAQLPITSCAVWDKEWIGPGGNQGLRPSYEMIALMCRPGAVITNRGVPDVIRHKTGSHKPNGHPAEKPVGLATQILHISGFEKGRVIDPFLGSGTTAVAAKAMGFQCVGIEAEERYCEIAARRLDQGVLDFGASA